MSGNTATRSFLVDSPHQNYPVTLKTFNVNLTSIISIISKSLLRGVAPLAILKHKY